MHLDSLYATVTAKSTLLKWRMIKFWGLGEAMRVALLLWILFCIGGLIFTFTVSVRLPQRAGALS